MKDIKLSFQTNHFQSSSNINDSCNIHNTAIVQIQTSKSIIQLLNIF